MDVSKGADSGIYTFLREGIKLVQYKNKGFIQYIFFKYFLELILVIDA